MLLAAGHSWQREPGLARWSGALVAILLLHAGAALGGMIVWDSIEPPAPPPAAILLELAPMPVAPPAPQIAAPQEPEPEPQPEPELPVDISQFMPPVPELPLTPPDIAVQEVDLPIPELPLTPPDIPAPEVELPKPEKKKAKEAKPKPPKEKPKKEKKPEPAPAPAVAQKPKAEPVQQAATSAAPVQPAPAPAAPSSADVARRTAAEANWQGILLAHLERHKKYPRSARRQHAEGTALLRFRMDRTGQVLSFSLARSAGYDALDEEVLAMIQRAAPLPALPAELPDDTVEIVVPVQFMLR